jgi:replicative DNA helicase
VPTKFSELDALTAGLQPGDLIIATGRPSMGKTAFALNIMDNAASAGAPGLFFSLEMSKEALVERLVAAEGNVDSMQMRSGRMSQSTWIGIGKAFTALSDRPIWIDDQAGYTVTEIRSQARRWRLHHAKDGPALIVVDYVQIVAADSRGETRDREVAEISAGLKAMAKDLRCPVLALSQLNRSCEARADKRPMMSDLRDSGSIEQDADVIAFLYRDEVYSKDQCRPEDRGVAEVIVAKQRNGPTATLKLKWTAESSRFANLSHRSER